MRKNDAGKHKNLCAILKKMNNSTIITRDDDPDHAWIAQFGIIKS